MKLFNPYNNLLKKEDIFYLNIRASEIAPQKRLKLETESYL